MPLYEYQCDACDRRFEVIRKFSDQPLDVCPTCGGSVRKLQSAPAIQFKGSGWYITDYAKKDSGTPGKTEEAGKGGQSESSSPKESKNTDGGAKQTEAASGKGDTTTSSSPASPSTGSTGSTGSAGSTKGSA